MIVDGMLSHSPQHASGTRPPESDFGVFFPSRPSDVFHATKRAKPYANHMPTICQPDADQILRAGRAPCACACCVLVVPPWPCA